MTTPVVVFPDAVTLVVAYLQAELSLRSITAPVRARVPVQWPAPFAGFVRIDRLGGVRHNIVVDAPSIGVEVWHDADHRAADLMGMVRALMFAMRGRTLTGHPVYRVEEAAGPAALPDPVTNTPRYVCQFVVHVRGLEEP